MEEKRAKLYPHIAIHNNKKPRHLFAFPFIGFLIKIILLIPVWIIYPLLLIIFTFFFVVNPFVILFTGTYWNPAYTFFLDFMRYNTKVTLYLYGLCDKYPGFYLGTDNLFELDIDKPKKPNKGLAFPVFGLFVRIILLIPYLIFSEVLKKGSMVSVISSWFTATFKSIYPESLYEFERDTLRVANAQFAYILNLTDEYPSFYISMDHQTVKIVLILAGAFLTFSNPKTADTNKEEQYRRSVPYQYGNHANPPVNGFDNFDSFRSQ
jgi:hypothetical protein